MQNTEDICYATYLSNISQTSKSIKATLCDSLYNEQGTLIAPKGAPISPKTRAIIAKHKLLKPLDNAISVSYTHLTLPTIYSV